MGLSRPLPPPLPLALLQGGHLTWEALSNFQKCEPAVAEAAGYSCSVFLSRHPRTISMSVLVVVEMFNALNNLSENTSLLQVGRGVGVCGLQDPGGGGL